MFQYSFMRSKITGGIMPAIPKSYLDEIKSVVEDIVADIEKANGHYPKDIIDQVFLEIESKHRREYNTWIKLPNGSLNDRFVNPYIGSIVRRSTGLKVIAYPVKPKSKLIKGYSALGH